MSRRDVVTVAVVLSEPTAVCSPTMIWNVTKGRLEAASVISRAERHVSSKIAGGRPRYSRDGSFGRAPMAESFSWLHGEALAI
jgi:hypothetical protein